jgi:hypothetical protein
LQLRNRLPAHLSIGSLSLCQLIAGFEYVSSCEIVVAGDDASLPACIDIPHRLEYELVVAQINPPV